MLDNTLGCWECQGWVFSPVWCERW